jgi:hypothetical protein
MTMAQVYTLLGVLAFGAVIGLSIDDDYYYGRLYNILKCAGIAVVLYLGFCIFADPWHSYYEYHCGRFVDHCDDDN